VHYAKREEEKTTERVKKEIKRKNISTSPTPIPMKKNLLLLRATILFSRKRKNNQEISSPTINPN